jgi:RimJ/RimL family protein N-acetyltransferase
VAPALQTRRLLLQPRLPADTEACLAMDREPEMVRFIAEIGQLLGDPAAHRVFVEARTRGPYPPGLGYWTLRLREAPSDFLGWVLLIPINGQGPEVEIGWRLKRAAWGQGYASEAAATVLRHGLGGLGLSEVVADIDPANLGSIRVAEKIGLRRRGATPDWPDAVRYALSREEWDEKAGS